MPFLYIVYSVSAILRFIQLQHILSFIIFPVCNLLYLQPLADAPALLFYAISEYANPQSWFHIQTLLPTPFRKLSPYTMPHWDFEQITAKHCIPLELVESPFHPL